MKIIHIIDKTWTYGGVNSFVFDLAEEQASRGYDVSIIGILSPPQNIKEYIRKANTYKTYSIDAPSKIKAILFYKYTLRKLIKKISSGEPTILNLHLRLSTLIGVISSIGINNITRVETYHSLYPYYWLQYNLCKYWIKKYIRI